MKVSRSMPAQRLSSLTCAASFTGLALASLLLFSLYLHQGVTSMDDEDLIRIGQHLPTRDRWSRRTTNQKQQRYDLQTYAPLERSLDLPTALDIPYDIFDCPDAPPVGYPYQWNVLQVLDHWGIDDTDIPSDYLYQGLCVFDWRSMPDQHKVETYRQAELPFVLQHHPAVVATAERWSTPGYLQALLGNAKLPNEHSLSNHFMFWRPQPNHPSTLSPPTDQVELSFAEWYRKAHELEDQENNNHHDQTKQEHWYFRLNGSSQSNTFLYDELPFFRTQPHKSTLFMVDSKAERGINCRFGMKGVFAESHFDPSRNWITILGGQRRYLLSTYRECDRLELFPPHHPSGRHSKVNWSRPRQELHDHPEYAATFGQATVNEVVLQAGDALYLPTSWFHAIVSLNINYQCNARSGVTRESFDVLADCGFGSHQRSALR